MKKIAFSLTLTVFFIAFSCVTSFAAITLTTNTDATGNFVTGNDVTIPDDGDGATGESINITLSPKVYIKYNVDSTNNGADYAMMTLNSQGYRIFGVASDYSGIWFTGFDDSADMLANGTVDTSAVDSSTAFTDWSAVGN